jgi:hypothetical protein
MVMTGITMAAWRRKLGQVGEIFARIFIAWHCWTIARNFYGGTGFVYVQGKLGISVSKNSFLVLLSQVFIR